MSKLRITKEVTFDCAHMLSGHNGLCANLHGHTYKVQITVEGDPIKEGSSKDMLIDFKDLKDAIEDSIMDLFDHALVISGEGRSLAEESLRIWADTWHMRVVILRNRSTAENIAEYIQSKLRNYLYNVKKLYNIEHVYVKLWETPTSFVEV